MSDVIQGFIEILCGVGLSGGGCGDLRIFETTCGWGAWAVRGSFCEEQKSASVDWYLVDGLDDAKGCVGRGFILFNLLRPDRMPFCYWHGMKLRQRFLLQGICVSVEFPVWKEKNLLFSQHGFLDITRILVKTNLETIHCTVSKWFSRQYRILFQNESRLCAVGIQCVECVLLSLSKAKSQVRACFGLLFQARCKLLRTCGGLCPCDCRHRCSGIMCRRPLQGFWTQKESSNSPQRFFLHRFKSSKKFCTCKRVLVSNPHEKTWDWNAHVWLLHFECFEFTLLLRFARGWVQISSWDFASLVFVVVRCSVHNADLFSFCSDVFSCLHCRFSEFHTSQSSRTTSFRDTIGAPCTGKILNLLWKTASCFHPQEFASRVNILYHYLLIFNFLFSSAVILVPCSSFPTSLDHITQMSHALLRLHLLYFFGLQHFSPSIFVCLVLPDLLWSSVPCLCSQFPASPFLCVNLPFPALPPLEILPVIFMNLASLWPAFLLSPVSSSLSNLISFLLYRTHPFQPRPFLFAPFSFLSFPFRPPLFQVLPFQSPSVPNPCSLLWSFLLHSPFLLPRSFFLASKIHCLGDTNKEGPLDNFHLFGFLSGEITDRNSTNISTVSLTCASFHRPSFSSVSVPSSPENTV